MNVKLPAGFILCVGAQWRWKDREKSVLPGLDRGASEDLSLQALKSDAVLWKTKGTGRGTNMVLCRPGGRCFFYFSLTFLLFLSVVLPSFFGLSSYAFQGCGQTFVKTLGWFEKKKNKEKQRLSIWLFLPWIEPVPQRIPMSRFSDLCGSGIRTDVLRSPHWSGAHTRTHGAHGDDWSAPGGNVQLPAGIHAA